MKYVKVTCHLATTYTFQHQMLLKIKAIKASTFTNHYILKEKQSYCMRDLAWQPIRIINNHCLT